MEEKLESLNLKIRPSLAPQGMDMLISHNWPGNVRELENVVERALIEHRKGRLNFKGLTEVPSPTPRNSMEDSQERWPLRLDELNAMHIKKVLKKAGGKISGPGGAAEMLGINQSTLRGKMDKLGIPYRRNKPHR
jgi:hydrogenase-4 transcriptional activator